ADLTILKDGAGQVYWPGFNLNMIGNMLPGGGYQAKLTVASTLTYLANSVSMKSVFKPTIPVFYDQLNSTGNNMTIGIPENAFDELPMIGDEIGVFDANGNLVGGSVFTGGNMAIAVWGNDKYSSEVDGLLSGNDFNLRIWNGISNRIIVIEIWEQGDGLYEQDDIQIAGKVSFGAIDEMAYSLGQNIPNPFKETTRISFYLPEASEINLTVFDVLGNSVEVLANGNYDAGEYSVEFDGSKYANGSYFYRLVANNFVMTKQMEISD
ncbi:MAG: T9SS type A sorting domain-containing protein, partial [Bacteroidota bacterium]|nr:T9SS type A sorting domain-containing protein [Bacteroidota bacterium]